MNAFYEQNRKIVQWIGGGIAATAMGGLGWMLIAGYEPPPEEGRVINEDFTPAHYEEYQQPHYITETYTYTDSECSTDFDGKYSCRPVTKTGTRTVTYYTTEERHVPDDWDVQIQACETNDKGEEKCRTNWIDVSEATFEQCKIGSFYRKETKCLPQ